MTKLIEQAIRQLRDLPEERQDAVAARVLDIIEDKDPWADLPPAVQASQLAAIKEGLAALDRGDFVDQSTIDKWVDSLPLRPRSRK
jgi:predicted transcriptional regulator